MSASKFDIAALHAAIDAERIARGMSWTECAKDMSRSFDTTKTRPISASTLSTMGTRRVVEGDGVLHMLRWLGRTPESVVPGHIAAPGEDAMLRSLEPGRILRFDAKRIHHDLDAARRERGMTWAQVAGEIGGPGAPSLTRLAQGGRVGFPEIMDVFRWLGRPAAHYTRIAPQ